MPAGTYVIGSLNNGGLLGSTGPSFDAPFRASTGYVLAKDFWGPGIAEDVASYAWIASDRPRT